MKKSKWILLILTLTLLVCIGVGTVSAYAAETAQIGDALLSVNGTATVRTEADECTFGGTIECVGNDMKSAEENCAEICKKIYEAFKPYGSVRENHSSAYPSYGSAGYTASRYLTFRTERTEKLSEIREALAKAGIACLEGVTYLCKDDSQLRLNALQQAIENARAKAAALGATGEIVRVEETSCYPSGCGGEDGTVGFVANVRVLFAHKPKEEAAHRAEGKPEGRLPAGEPSESEKQSESRA